MNEHYYAYLKRLATKCLPGYAARTRDAQREYVIQAVQQYPEHERSFIAGCAWSMLGYGGGL